VGISCNCHCLPLRIPCKLGQRLLMAFSIYFEITTRANVWLGSVKTFSIRNAVPNESAGIKKRSL